MLTWPTRQSWARAAMMLLPVGLLLGCTASPPATAEQANLASCTASADAVYQSENYNGLARTSQNGLLYGATPNQVFEGQRMGTLNARNNQIKDCMNNGNPDETVPGGAALPTPQILGDSPNSGTAEPSQSATSAPQP